MDRAATLTRTRAVVGGASIGTFLAILAVVGVHDRSKPASNVSTANDNSASTSNPGTVQPNLDQNPFGDRFSRRFPGGGFSATPPAAPRRTPAATAVDAAVVGHEAPT